MWKEKKAHLTDTENRLVGSRSVGKIDEGGIGKIYVSPGDVMYAMVSIAIKTVLYV